jgi:serine/threonine protein phosphatase PrpC
VNLWRHHSATLANTRGYGNQDAYGFNADTFVVADGVSRSVDPAAAAQAVVKTTLGLSGAANKRWGNEVLIAADIAAEDADGLTTITGLRFVSETEDAARFVVFQVGDSMLLRVRGRKVERVTAMHSYVEGLVQAGYITRAQAKRHPRSNVITSCAGRMEDKQVRSITSRSTDALVLCTDGVHGLLEAEDILRCLQAEDPAKALCEAGQAAGSSDDATAIVLFGPRWA